MFSETKNICSNSLGFYGTEFRYGDFLRCCQFVMIVAEKNSALNYRRYPSVGMIPSFFSTPFFGVLSKTVLIGRPNKKRRLGSNKFKKHFIQKNGLLTENKLLILSIKLTFYYSSSEAS